MSDEQDWRLKVEVEGSGGVLDGVLARLRGPNVDDELRDAVPHDVVLTHDGRLLFAYAARETTLTDTRRAIERVASSDGLRASFFASRWDDVLDDWRQIDPPATEEGPQGAAAERDAAAIETRTLVASAGKLIRGSFEQSLSTWADKLDLQCSIVEHPHLLTTQVCFTVTGAKHKIDEFAEGLKAEAITTLRAEGVVMLSPL